MVHGEQDLPAPQPFCIIGGNPPEFVAAAGEVGSLGLLDPIILDCGFRNCRKQAILVKKRQCETVSQDLSSTKELTDSTT